MGLFRDKQLEQDYKELEEKYDKLLSAHIDLLANNYNMFRTLYGVFSSLAQPNTVARKNVADQVLKIKVALEEELGKIKNVMDITNDTQN